MPIVNTAGKLTRLEGGDLATIALMAAFLAAPPEGGESPPAAADEAITIYTEVIERTHAFNQQQMKAAANKIAAVPMEGNPHEIIAKLLAQMLAAVNTIPGSFRKTSAWCREAEKMLKQSGFVKNADGQWAHATQQ